MKMLLPAGFTHLQPQFLIQTRCNRVSWGAPVALKALLRVHSRCSGCRGSSTRAAFVYGCGSFTTNTAVLCSHRKKRMRQIKKMMQRGLLDPEKEDPFSLFVASTNIRYCFYHDTHKILGNTFGMCVLQVSSGFICQTRSGRDWTRLAHVPRSCMTMSPQAASSG